jgi:hypothetical protein
MKFEDLSKQEQDWIDSYVNGTIAPEDFEALQNRMLESETLRRIMRRYLNIDSALRADCEVDNVSPWIAEEPAETRRFGAIIPAAIAAGLAFFLGLGLMKWKAPEMTPEVNSGVEKFAEGFAVVDRVFNTGDAAYREGDTLGAEVFEIANGTVDIQFFSGAMMTVEGPARIALKSAWEATCIEGAVRMRVPPAARGFKLQAPSTEIVDLGTEFGLVVRNGQGHVEVFDGEISLKHHDENERIMKKGSALGLTKNGPSVAATKGQVTFPDPGKISSRKVQNLQGFENWKTHRDTLAQDKRLIAYYTFDREDSQSLIPNLTIPRNPEFDGAVILAEPVDGRWPALKSALEFRRPGSRVRVNIPGEFPAFTFACWVRIDSLDRQYNALFMADGYERGEPHWQIRDDGKMMLSVMIDETRQHPKYPQSRFHHVYLSPPMWDTSMSGQWVHLASSFDPATKTVSHFVDGQRISREEMEPDFFINTLRIGNGEIGNWGQPFREDPTFAIRNLNGRMDEMAIFRSALTDAEISELYERSRK